MRKFSNIILTVPFFFFFLIIDLYAQNFSGGFNFNLPYDDTVSTRRFLPSFPAKAITANDFVSISSDGHFQINGKSLRFYGANLVGGGAFPDTSKAWYVAGRFRKMGFNLARFHHMDSPTNTEGAGLFANMSDTRHFNSFSLNKLDYLLAALKKNGVYANINLNVSRTFKTTDGIPDADSLVHYAKGMTIFDPQLISLQKEYARQLLTHVNPYTGLSLVNDPVMAMVEITNENSLYRMWHDNELRPFAEGGSLTIRHTKMLDTMWNKFLLNKYKTSQNLSDSWNKGIVFSQDYKNLIINGDIESPSIATNWVMELHNGALASMTKDTVNAYKGKNSAKISITNVTGTDWHIQWKQIQFSLKKDSLYTIEFAARADSSRTINVTVMRDNDPYNGYGSQDFSLTTQWKVFTYTIKATEDNNGNGRLSFSFKNSKGSFWFDEIKLLPTGLKGLVAGESLDNMSVRRTNYNDSYGYSDARIKDISEFYIGLSDSYYAEMKNYLKNTLGVKVPILSTNWNIGPGDLTTQSKLDYIDNHAYWQHPVFPNIPWSSTDWYITNTSMLKASDGGTMPSLFGGMAVQGKPYTVSEYNHPFPNRYQTEMMLFTLAYLSFHNTDAIEFFEYNSMFNYESDWVTGFFSISRNSALMALVPSCALAFRNNFISKANETINISYSQNSILMLPKSGYQQWWGVTYFPQTLSLIHSVKNASFSADSLTDFSKLPKAPASPYKTDTDEILLNTDQGLLTVNTPKFAGVAGFMNASPNTNIGNMTMVKANDFGTITWVSLTEDSLCSAKKSLITVSSKLQNTGMTWDGTTTVHNFWGLSPTEIFPLDILLRLNIKADSIKVYPLDALGREAVSPAVYLPVSRSIFEVRFNQNDYKTLWYGIESFLNNSTDVENSTNFAESFKLEQNYPNPFNNSTIIKYSLPYESHIKIDIFDALGKRVINLFDRDQQKGTYMLRWNGRNKDDEEVKSGIYFVQLKSDKHVETKKILLLK